ncbi:MAG TPA: type VI secretion system protein TssA [Longimicrobiaceae bacterium]|nr:type VI secretion system protein TssA [Longimicrobiaceae bacterium]
MAAARPFAVDVGRFLAPIPGGDPGGELLRYEGTYDRIREARREDDRSVPQGIWQRDLKRADWGRVEALCTEVLESRSKDLQVSAWLLEAWMHLHGFAGTREGLAVILALSRTFWDELHPRPEPEDPEARGPVFEWINERLAVTLAGIKVSRPEAADALPYSWFQWQEALRLDNLAKKDAGAARKPDPRKGAEPEQTLSRGRVLASITLTPRRFYEEVARDLCEAAETAYALQALLDERMGRAAPGLVRFTGTLNAIHDWVKLVLEDKPVLEEEEEPAPAAPAPRASAPAHEEVPVKIEVEGEAVRRTRAISSRDEAYRMLNEVSEYLLRTEPHSPTPFLLQRAVAWGGMSLSDLLVEFLRDGYDLKTLRIFLGMVEPGNTR